MSRPVASGPHSAILEVRDLAKHFGGVRAVDGVSCRVPEGMIYAVIGPNGAGKTTFFNCLNGIEKPTSGSILFDGADITGLAPHRVARASSATSRSSTWPFNASRLPNRPILPSPEPGPTSSDDTGPQVSQY